MGTGGVRRNAPPGSPPCETLYEFMKMTSRFTFLVLCVLLAGCSRSDQAKTDSSTDTPVTAREVKEKTKDAAAAAGSYVAQNKDEFLSAADQKLKELDAKISELARKSEAYKDDAKAQADKALAALKDQRGAVSDQFEKLKQASSEAWNGVKAGFSTAMDELERGYENAKAKFN